MEEHLLARFTWESIVCRVTFGHLSSFLSNEKARAQLTKLQAGSPTSSVIQHIYPLKDKPIIRWEFESHQEKRAGKVIHSLILPNPSSRDSLANTTRDA